MLSTTPQFLAHSHSSIQFGNRGESPPADANVMYFKTQVPEKLTAQNTRLLFQNETDQIYLIHNKDPKKAPLEFRRHQTEAESNNWGKVIISNSGKSLGYSNKKYFVQKETHSFNLFSAQSSSAFANGPMAKEERDFLEQIEKQVSDLNLKTNN